MKGHDMKILKSIIIVMTLAYNLATFCEKKIILNFGHYIFLYPALQLEIRKEQEKLHLIDILKITSPYACINQDKNNSDLEQQKYVRHESSRFNALIQIHHFTQNKQLTTTQRLQKIKDITGQTFYFNLPITEEQQTQRTIITDIHRIAAAKF